jgi:tRNA modification GTPase
MIINDTIAALATPPGIGGIGILRLSGTESLAIINTIFHPRRRGRLRSHTVRYGHIKDPANETIIDEVLVTFMRAPRSFTREDTVEIACHGGPLPIQRTLELILQRGARLANPGEFTMRAFLNGRIDLTQAEATLDIIQSQTSKGLALAQAQLGGWLAKEVRSIRGSILAVLAYITATIDFPEDEVEFQDVVPALHESVARINRIRATADHGIVYRQGARVVLVGRPNVGKSSLLNSLLRINRAIVTPIPGTTRDTLEETANLNGIPVTLIDTAGMTDSSDPIERLGVERSRAALAEADIALLVLDSHAEMDDDDVRIAKLTYDKPTLIIWNKSDLLTEIGDYSNLLPQRTPIIAHPSMIGFVATSTLTGSGIDELVNKISETLVGTHASATSDAYLVTNPRHRDALSRGLNGLIAALECDEQGLPIDLMACELHTALAALGEIIGESITDDLLDTIFSTFCIGK